MKQVNRNYLLRGVYYCDKCREELKEEYNGYHCSECGRNYSREEVEED